MVGMTSWRDTASQQAQDDLDGLLNATLPFAHQMIEMRGELYPFGASVSTSGDTTMLAGDPDVGERPPSQSVLDTLLEGLIGNRDGLRAVALCAEVRLPDSDAVRVELEHREGHAIAVLLPYKKKRLGRRVEFSALRAGSATQQVWI